MPSSTFDLAVVELVYYVPASFPVIYCLWRHRYTGLSGWIFLLGYVLLQLIGSGMIVSVGTHGTPSHTAVIIIGVGLSPLMVGLAGVTHEWSKLAVPGQLVNSKKMETIVIVVYHILVIGAIGIYATGASNASKGESDGKTLWRAGIIMLLTLWAALCAAFLLMIWRVRTMSPKILFWALVISLVLLGWRLFYQTAAVFNGTFIVPIALQVVFEFLPGAITILAMVIGGITSVEKAQIVRERDKAAEAVPMTSRSPQSSGEV